MAMMRKAVCSCTLTILGFVLLLPACDLTEEYDITIWNDTSSNLSIFLDGSFLTEIAASGRITIRDVEAGNHDLEAKKAGVIIETISFDLDVLKIYEEYERLERKYYDIKNVADKERE